MFANHDHAAVELYAYSNVKREDEFTEEFKGCLSTGGTSGMWRMTRW